jgi:hypothetical protein
VIMNDIRLRGLAVAGNDAASRKSPHNHAQTARNLKRSLRNAAADARLIQAEGLDSKSAVEIAASLADALEELCRLQRNLERRIRRDPEIQTRKDERKESFERRQFIAGWKQLVVTLRTRKHSKERCRMKLTPLHLALGVNASDLSIDLIREACPQAVREREDLDSKSTLPLTLPANNKGARQAMRGR